MKVLCGYNVNIDALYRMTDGEISELLEISDKDELQEKICHPTDGISSLSDFVAGLVLHM